ncbi:cyclophilin-like domain-containing protein [Phlyctochytrium arcticum]|nr:cyclophilin-like domain-containing protein [Phlyctochytrium arcticum]
MGKNTDKLYVTHSEHAAGPGGFKRKAYGSEFKGLPFYCCSLSLQPFEHPVCTKDGMVFDLTNIIPWLKKHDNKNPVSGETLLPKDLIKVTFHKNADDQYFCPITFKVFNEHTHIVAIATSGNVYSFEAVEQLNIKTKNWKDLMTEEPFKRKDVITIQDPHSIQKRNINDFYYVKNDLKVENVELEKAKKKLDYKINAVGATDRVLKAVQKSDAEARVEKAKKDGPPPTLTPSFVTKEKQAYNTAFFTNGAASSSLTSTAVPIQTANTSAKWKEEEYMFERIKGKGYAQIKTNLGDLNLELLCGDTPRAAYNFVQLAKKGYYKDTSFHRSIKHFMIQGGDPTGTGRGGESIWGEPFVDEFKTSLTHNARGILSMANKGKNTNTSQFFITYRPCEHLDNKHTIFGKVVGGLDVLSKMEAVPTEDDEKPSQPITILDINIFVDPFETFQEEIAKQQETGNGPLSAAKKNKRKAQKAASGVGEGVGAAGSAIDWSLASEVGEQTKKKTKVTSGGFGNFDSW